MEFLCRFQWSIGAMEIRALENTTRCLLWARTWQKQGGFQSLKDMAHGNHWEIRNISLSVLFPT